MPSGDALSCLAAASGLATEYRDAWGERHEVGAGTLRALIGAMGIRCASDAEARASLVAIEDEIWRTPLDPVSVLRQAEARPEIALALDEAMPRRRIVWMITLESGARLEGSAELDAMRRLDAREVGGVRMSRRALMLPAGLELGYHTIE